MSAMEIKNLIKAIEEDQERCKDQKLTYDYIENSVRLAKLQNELARIEA